MTSASRETRPRLAGDSRRTWWDGADVSDTLTTTIHQQYMADIGHFGAVLCISGIAREEKSAKSGRGT